MRTGRCEVEAKETMKRKLYEEGNLWSGVYMERKLYEEETIWSGNYTKRKLYGVENL